MFHLDPLELLGGVVGARALEVDDPGLAWSLRLAAHRVIMEDAEQARREATK